MAHHLTINGVDFLIPFTLILRWLGSLQPPRRLLKHISHVRGYRIIVLDHLLERQQILCRVGFVGLCYDKQKGMLA